MTQLDYSRLTCSFVVLVAILIVNQIVINMRHMNTNWLYNYKSYKNTRMKTNYSFSKSDIIKDIYVDQTGRDIIVFIRIQKTGSSQFHVHLTNHLDFDDACTCKTMQCRCLWRVKRNVLFIPGQSSPNKCGKHADWTTVNTCVQKYINKRLGRNSNRRFHYITLLRDPVDRFLSEWLHVRRGATWTRPLQCSGKILMDNGTKACFKGSDWSNASLEEFYSCHHNFAINRQTRMLSNLSLVNCFDMDAMEVEERNAIMLNSAKENLRNMPFFGLNEHQVLSQLLFEKTFHLKFVRPFQQKKQQVAKLNIPHSVRFKLEEINKYDIMLYEYAEALFAERCRSNSI